MPIDKTSTEYKIFELFSLIRIGFKRRILNGKTCLVIEEDPKLLEDMDNLIIQYTNETKHREATEVGAAKN